MESLLNTLTIFLNMNDDSTNDAVTVFKQAEATVNALFGTENSLGNLFYFSSIFVVFTIVMLIFMIFRKLNLEDKSDRM